MLLDTRYSVETPEGVALSFRPAGVVARGSAYLIDFLVRGAILVALFLIVVTIGGIGGGFLFAFMLIVFFALEWLYPVVCELAWGATLGKQTMGLRVVLDNGLPITPAASFVRNLLRAADILPFGYAIGICALLMRSDFKRLGDLAAGTVVIYSPGSEQEVKLPHLKPLLPARALSVREQKAVVNWAMRTFTLSTARCEELALLAQSICPSATDVPDTRARDRLMRVACSILEQRS